MLITPKDQTDLIELGRTLLDAAGDDPTRVRTTFMGAQMGYEVDDDLARAIGRDPDEQGDPNAQVIMRDRVGEVGDNPTLPNLSPGSVQAPDVPDSPSAVAPHGDDALIEQPDDDSPRVTTFGEGTGDTEQTTQGSTGQDDDRAGVQSPDAGDTESPSKRTRKK